MVVTPPAFAAPGSPVSGAAHSIATIAGDGTVGAIGDGGVAVNAELHSPSGLATDLLGNLYVADMENNKVRKVLSPTVQGSDLISTFAGNGKRGFKGDKGPALVAELNDPSGLAIDSSGDVFIADTGNNRIREVNASGVITTLAGTGHCSDRSGDGGPATAASLCAPAGVAVDGPNVYISDTGRNEVRVVNGKGVISAFAGSGMNRGERLDSPAGLAVDALHDVFIADTGHDRVLKVSLSGVVSVIAGDRGDGNKAAATHRLTELRHPTGVAVDPTGVVYISDTYDNRLVDVGPGGAVTVFAGTGSDGFAGDGGPATSARLDHPTGVAVGGTAVFFADSANQRIRGVFVGPPPVLPEAPRALLLMIGGVAVGGATLLLARRRRRSDPAAGVDRPGA